MTKEQAVILASSDHIYNAFPLAEYPRAAEASPYEGPMSLWSALQGGIIGEAQARELAVTTHRNLIAHAQRWLGHYRNRLEYERALLAADGGIPADQTRPEKGGACRCWASPRGGWSYIVKVNRVSVTVLDNWGNGGPNFMRTIALDKLTELMTAAQVERARAAGRLVESEDRRGFYMRIPPATELGQEA